MDIVAKELYGNIKLSGYKFKSEEFVHLSLMIEADDDEEELSRNNTRKKSWEEPDSKETRPHLGGTSDELLVQLRSTKFTALLT